MKHFVKLKISPVCVLIYLYFQIFSLHFRSLFITNRGKFFSNSFFKFEVIDFIASLGTSFCYFSFSVICWQSFNFL